MLAALKTDRNSIGIEIDPHYCRMALKRLHHENASLFSTAHVEFEEQMPEPDAALAVGEQPGPCPAKSRRRRKKRA